MPDDAVVLLFAASALLVRVGLAWYVTGQARSKNAAGAVLRAVTDLCVTTLAYWALGAAILHAAGASPASLDAGRLLGLGAPAAGGAGPARVFFYLVTVLIATAPVAGALAERSRFLPGCVVPAVLGGVVVPVIAHGAWVRGAWLQRLGYVDVAGAGVLHLAGGVFALAGAVLVGPRAGKYNRDGSSNLIPGHGVPVASVGVMLLFAGWLPYVLGAAVLYTGPATSPAGFNPLGQTALNVLLAAAAGGLVSLLVGNARYGKPDVYLTYSGLLGGLVAITGGASVVSPLSAVVIGAVAGVVVPLATVALDLRWHVDDPAGGVSVHVVGGLWGVLAVGIFGYGTIASKLRQTGAQLLGAAIITAVALAASAALFLALRATFGLRVTDGDEFDGLDLAELDLNAYPDFQQTMIKSYHLREA